MPYRVFDERNLQGGVNAEDVPWVIPAGTLADANNLIFDRRGIARQRNGSSAIFSGSQTAFASSMGWAHSQDANLIEELYGVNGASGVTYAINKTTGAAVSIGNPGFAGAVGRAVRHFGFCVFPIKTSTRRSIMLAGQTSSTIFTNTASVVFTANAQQLTFGGSDVTTSIRVGAFVFGSNGSNIDYTGRVVSIDSSTKFTVWPTPPLAFTATAGLLTFSPYCVVSPYSASPGGACAASFQNRLLFGNTVDLSSTSQSLVADRRVNYSPLPTESTGQHTGAAFAQPYSWPTKNWFEVPGADPIVAMEPVDDDELLILTTQGVVVFSGTLATQTNDFASGVTWDISPLNTNAGCLSDMTVQRTPHGIIWASAEGIMAYTGGGKLTDLTEGRMHTYWRNLTRGANFAVHGAAYARNHYVVTGSSAGNTFALAFNLDNGTWAPLSNLDCFLGSPRPTDASQVFTLRWWSTSGGAPSMAGGQVVRYDPIFAPDAWGQTKRDSDGNTINFSAITRSVTDDKHTARIVRRIGLDYQAEMAAASVNVYGGARLDWTDTDGAELVLLGALSNTSVLTVTGATNATPVVITTSAAHGLQDGDFVDVHAILGNTNANGHYRVTVVSATTFRLNGSKGNAAYTSGGDVKRITQAEFVGSSMDIGPATYLLVTNSGTVNRFELHGFRLGVLEIPRGMG